MSCVLRFGFLTIALSLSSPGFAQSPQTFSASDNSYTFQFPESFSLSHMFADGTGDVTGVTASSMENGDVNITFSGPRDSGNINEINEENQQAIIDEFTQAIAVLPSIKFQSAKMTTMLGQPAIDMVFTNKRFKTVAINRYVFTVVDGEAYSFECIYREEKADQFAPACDLAVSTVRLLEDSADTSNDENTSNTATDGACTELELNRLTTEVTELASNLLMKDQLPATIERVKKAHEAAAQVEERSGSNPSEQDCIDVNAIIATLQ